MKKGLTSLLSLVLLLSLIHSVSAEGEYRYHGIVKDENSNPIKDATVKVYDVQKIQGGQEISGYLMNTLKTKEDGSFTINLRWAGGYKFVISKNGYTQQTRTVESTSTFDVDLEVITLTRTLILDLPSSQRTATPGKKLTIPFQIINNGKTDEDVELNATCSLPWITTINDELGEIGGTNLRAGTSIDLSLLVFVPMNAEEVAEVNLTAIGSIELTRTLSITPVDEEPELLSCLYPSKQGSTGGTVDFSITASNPFYSSYEANLSVSGLPTEWTSRALNDEGDQIKTVYLPGEGIIEVKLRIEIPETTPEGSYSFELTTAFGRWLDRVSLSATVERRVQTPSIITSYPSQVDEVGEEASFPLVLDNPGATDETFLLSLENLPSQWQGGFLNTEGANIRSVLVEAGTEETITAVLTPSVFTEIGDYLIHVKADSASYSGGLNLTVSLVEARARVLGLDIKTRYPILRVEQGKEASFPITLENLGETDEVITLFLEGLPDGWHGSFTNQEGAIIRSMLLEAGEEDRVFAVFRPSMYASLKDYGIGVRAESPNLSEELSLTVGLIGKIEMKIILTNLYDRLTMGVENVINVRVENTGYSALTMVELDAVSSVASIEVECDPPRVLIIESGEEAVFDLKVTALEGTAQGDYLLEMNAVSREMETEPIQMRLTVAASSSQTLVVGLVIAAAFGSVFLVYRRFKRR